jgi:ADP-L-glycero-D-manno-heptose 6-epimerase
VIVVTGAAGFIGSNIVRGLNALDRSDILAVDNLTNGEKHLNINALRFADFIDKDDLFDAISGITTIDAIFHQGACSDTTERNGRYMMTNNFAYSKGLLRVAEERGAKFIYASSAAVYGDGKNGFREDPACEYPLNVYGFSKMVFDQHVRQRLDRARCQIVGLRYFNVYGPQERHKGRMASVVMHLFDQLEASGELRLFQGSSGFRRDFIHVDDVVAVNLFFLSCATSGIFNCGTGHARSFVDIATRLRDLHGSGVLLEVPFPADLVGKYQSFTEAEISRLRGAGYDRPFLDLEDGVGRYYELLRSTKGYLR